ASLTRKRSLVRTQYRPPHCNCLGCTHPSGAGGLYCFSYSRPILRCNVESHCLRGTHFVSGVTVPKNGSTAVSPRRRTDAAPLIPLLARRVREVEARASRGKLGPTNKTRFQVIAMLVRDERSRIQHDDSLSSTARAELLKRLDGIA